MRMQLFVTNELHMWFVAAHASTRMSFEPR
jgi:hypothetical protein